MSSNLEDLRKFLSDDRETISIGEITALRLSENRSVLNADISVFPEGREITARITWDSVGPESGIFHFPAVGDYALVCFPDRQVDNAAVLKFFSNEQDRIPANAADGDFVIKTRPGETLWLTGQGKVFLSRGDGEPTENLVMGQKLKVFLKKLLDSLKSEVHVSGPPGHYTSTPQNPAISGYNQLGEENDGEELLSDFSFTEKGN